MPKKDIYTSKDVADILHVTPRTVQLWADSGVLKSWKTSGGHRRFSPQDVENTAAILQKKSLSQHEDISTSQGIPHDDTKSLDNAPQSETRSGDNPPHRNRRSGDNLSQSETRSGDNPLHRERRSGDSVSTGPARVLVIEDDPALLNLYRIVMEQWNLSIKLDFAADGYEGMLKIGRYKPSILILDLSLSNIDGFRIIEAVSRYTRSQLMTLIIISGLSPQEINEKLININDYTLMPKPIDFLKLEKMVAQRCS